MNLYIPFYCLLPGWICIFCCILSGHIWFMPDFKGPFYWIVTLFPFCLCFWAKGVISKATCSVYISPLTAGGEVARVLRVKRGQAQGGVAELSCLMGHYRIVVCNEMGSMLMFEFFLCLNSSCVLLQKLTSPTVSPFPQMQAKNSNSCVSYH